MNNYEEIIERIHAANMSRRESEVNVGPYRTHVPWAKMAMAASVAGLVALSLFTIINDQPRPLEMAKVYEPSHCQEIDRPAAETSEMQSSPCVQIALHDDKLSVVCQDDCAVEDVLQRFEQTLSSLN